MAKKHSASSAQGKLRKKNVKHTRDRDIDFSDIPELSDEQLKSMRRIGRPLLGTAARKMIAVRLDPDVLESIKSEAKRSKKPYQSLINEILAKHVKKAA